MKRLPSIVLPSVFTLAGFCGILFADGVPQSFSMADVSNVAARVTAARAARLAEGKLIAEYERHMKSLADHRTMTGGGEQSETEDMERAVPRLRGLAEIEEKGRAENPSVRADAAFADAFAPVLALEDDEVRRYVAHLAKAGDDLGRSDKALFDKTCSAAFQAELATKLSRSGCSYTGGVFTYSSVKKLDKLRKAIERRLTGILE